METFDSLHFFCARNLVVGASRRYVTLFKFGRETRLDRLVNRLLNDFTEQTLRR